MRILRVLGWIATALLALASLGAAYILVTAEYYAGTAYVAAHDKTVCLTLRTAEALKFVTAEQRAEWAKNATVSAAVATERGQADYAVGYYASDCKLSLAEFERQRAKR